MSATPTNRARIARRKRPASLVGAHAMGWVAISWLCLVASASAHDFWVAPQQFRIAADTLEPFTLQVGHGSERRRSPLPLRRIVRFTATGPDGRSIDARPGLTLGNEQGDGAVHLGGEGAYVLALQTDFAAQSHLPARRFNEYVREEGLTPARQERGRTGRLEADGSERYARAAKAIVLVGEADARAHSAATARLGLPLEIVLERSPYMRPQPEDLPVRVYYRGRPLAGALVKFTDLGNDAAPLETRLTDGNGRARFSMPERGSWLLNVIWTRPLPASEETDFETVFSSLSFGFE